MPRSPIPKVKASKTPEELLKAFDSALPFVNSQSRRGENAEAFSALFDPLAPPLERAKCAQEFRSSIVSTYAHLLPIDKRSNIHGEEAYLLLKDHLPESQSESFVEIWGQPVPSQLKGEVAAMLKGAIASGGEITKDLNLDGLIQDQVKLKGVEAKLKAVRSAIPRLGNAVVSANESIERAEGLQKTRRDTQEKLDALSPDSKEATALAARIKSLTKEIDEWQAKAGEYVQEMGPARIKLFSQYTEERIELLKTKVALQADIYERAEVAHSEFTQSILAASPVTDDQALDYAQSIEFDSDTAKAIKAAGYDEKSLYSDLAEFYKLSHGTLRPFDLRNWKNSRAWALVNSRQINTSKKLTKTVLFHEIAHLYEDDPALKLATQEFMNQRNKRDDGRVYRLRDLTGRDSYKPDEVAIKGGFFDPYVGKIYRDGGTEVYAMGVQALANPMDFMRIMDKDPEHLNMVLGLMLAKSPVDDLVQSTKTAQHQANKHFRSSLRELADRLKWQGKVMRMAKPRFRPKAGDTLHVKSIKGDIAISIWKHKPFKENRQELDVFSCEYHFASKLSTATANTLPDIKMLAMHDALNLLRKGKGWDAIKGFDRLYMRAPDWFQSGMSLPYDELFEVLESV